MSQAGTNAIFTWNFDNLGWVNLGGVATSDIAVSVASDNGVNQRTVADQFIARGTDNRLYSRIQTNFVGGFTSYFAFRGPLHG